VFSIWLNDDMTKRDEILQAGYEILGSEGLEGLHARTVAAAVGVNHAAVHYYFPQRRDLLLGVLEYLCERFESDWQAFHARGTGKSGALAMSLAQATAYGKPASRFWKAWASLFVAAQSDEAILKRLQRHFTSWSKRLASELNAAAPARVKSGPWAQPGVLPAALLGMGIASQLMPNEMSAQARFAPLTEALGLR